MSPDDDLILTLTAGDRLTPAWQKLLRYFNAQLATCRAKNDGNLDASETAAMRGRIAVYKSLLELDKDRIPLD